MIDIIHSRRTFIKVGAMAGAGVLVASQVSCGDKEDVDFYTSTITGALTTLKTLLSNQADILDKGIQVAKTFNKAYQDGKFDTAMALFENLTEVINDVIMAVGAGMSDSIRITLALADVGIRAIAVLLKRQQAKPEVAASLKNRSLSPMQERQLSVVEALSNSRSVQAVFEASRP